MQRGQKLKKKRSIQKEHDEIRAEENSSHEKLEQLEAEQTAAQKAM